MRKTAPSPASRPNKPPLARLALAGLLLTTAVPAAAEGFDTLDGHGGPIMGLAVSQGGALALTASFDNALGLWSLPGGERLRWLDGHDAAVNAALFLDATRAVTVGDDFAAILWDLDEGTVLRRLDGHRAKVMDAALSPDGRFVATASWDGTVGLWPLDGGEARFLAGHAGAVDDVAFGADASTLYSASADGTVRLWDLESAESRAIVEHGFGVNELVVDIEAGWLAYGAVDGVTRVRDLATGATIADLTAERRPVLAMAHDAASGRLAVGDGEGYVMIVETEGWSVLRDFRAAKRGPVWALAWEGGAEGRLLAGGIADAAAVWPVGDGVDAPTLAGTERAFHADPATMSNGERQFVRKCSICHSLTPDGGRKAGPTLHGVFGRKAGGLAGYRYSQALASSDIVWTAESIARLFRDGPDVVTPGSKMPVQRIARAEDRQDLVEYLRARTR